MNALRLTAAASIAALLGALWALLKQPFWCDGVED